MEWVGERCVDVDDSGVPIVSDDEESMGGDGPDIDGPTGLPDEGSLGGGGATVSRPCGLVTITDINGRPFAFENEAAAVDGTIKIDDLPKVPAALQDIDALCRKNCSEQKRERDKVCVTVRKRVALWLKEHKCPSQVTAYKKRTTSCAKKAPAKKSCATKKKSCGCGH
jgi:hypothetical protein